MPQVNVRTSQRAAGSLILLAVFVSQTWATTSDDSG